MTDEAPRTSNQLAADRTDMAADRTEETAPLKQPAPLEDGAVELATRNVTCGCALAPPSADG